MGINTGVRKVWPFKCQNSENGPFIYFLYLKIGGFIPGGAEKGGIRAHIRTMSNIGSYPRECRKGRSKDLDPHMQNCNLGLFLSHAILERRPSPVRVSPYSH